MAFGLATGRARSASAHAAHARAGRPPAQGRCDGHALSGGERQRVALARALAPEPELVLLDEPFSSLDASLRGGLRREVELILRDAEATALLVTHDQEEALSLADRLAVMRDGEIVQVGPPVEVYGRRQRAGPPSSWARSTCSRGSHAAAESRPSWASSTCARRPAAPCTWPSGPSSWSCVRTAPRTPRWSLASSGARRPLQAAPRGRQDPAGAAALPRASRGGRQRVRAARAGGRDRARGLILPAQ